MMAKRDGPSGAASRRVRNASSYRRRDTRASAFRWAPAEPAGATSRKKRCVGLPSTDWKSTPAGLRPKAASTRSIVGSLPWGIATPSPSAVELRRSRSSRAWMSRPTSTSGWFAATRPASSSITSCFVRLRSTGITSSSDRMSLILMRPLLHLGLDQTEPPVVAPIEHGEALALGVGEHQELVLARTELADRLLHRHRRRRHALRSHDARHRLVVARVQHRRGDRCHAHAGGALVVTPACLQLLRLVLELVDGEKIGRASCRERGWMRVEVCGVEKEH